MIGFLEDDKKENWVKYLRFVIMVYNFTRFVIIGYFFYYFMYGRRFRMSVDFLFLITFSLDVDKVRKIAIYVIELRDKLRVVLVVVSKVFVSEVER